MSGRRPCVVAVAAMVAIIGWAPHATAEQGGEDSDRAREEGGQRTAPIRWQPRPRVTPRPRARAPSRDRDRGLFFTVGVELGASVTPGLDSSYGMAVGRGFSIGVGNGTIGAELLFGHNYTAESSFEQLRAANTTGETSLFMVGARLNRRRRSSIVSFTLGAARVRVPVLGADGSAVSVSGLGLAAGVGLQYPVTPALWMTADLRGVAAMYEIPREPYLEDASEQPGGTVTGTMSASDVSGFPLFGTAGVRVMF